MLGSSGPARWEALVDASITHRVAATAPCRVVVVPSRDPDPVGPIVALIGDDDETDELLEFAVRQADERHVDLILAHAWELAPGYPPELAPSSFGYDFALESAQAVLDGHLERTRTAHPAAKVSGRLVEGRPAIALLPLLRRAGLAVLGRHGSGTLRDVVLGSLGHQLLDDPPCPLVILPRD